MKRAVTVALAALLGLAVLTGIAWYSGLVDRMLVHRFVRQPQQEDLARQLDAPAGYPGRREPDFSPFEPWITQLGEARASELDALLDHASIVEIQRFFEHGRLSSEELVLYYVRRIQKYDGTLHSVSELDPDAIEVARRLDAERASGGGRGRPRQDRAERVGQLHVEPSAEWVQLRGRPGAKSIR